MSLRSPAAPALWFTIGRMVLLPIFVAAIVFGAVGAAPAFAEEPWWQINAETSPTNFAPGGEGHIFVALSNLGDAPIDGSKSPVVISNELPPGLTATAISAAGKNNTLVACSLATLQCTFTGVLHPYQQISVSIAVDVNQPSGMVTSLADHASVEGGGAAAVSRTLPIPVSGEVAGFGIESFELSSFNEDGTPATQAGSHPFQLTTTLVLNQTALNDPQESRFPVKLPKDLSFHLPPGLVGNPNAAEQCTMANFFALVLETNRCSPDSVVGVATVTAHEPLVAKFITVTVPVFNLVPAQGEPARFGFEVIGKIPVVIDTAVRSGRDYGVVVNVKDATETAGLLSSQVTFWGVPGESRHNGARGWECVAGGAFASQVKKACPSTSAEREAPFLTLPTSCAANPAAEPVVSTTQADSWADPGVLLGAEYKWMTSDGQPLGFTGCNSLPFTPAISVTPEQHSASTPTGLSVDVKVPQQTTLQAGALAEADVRDTTVTLPQGVQLSPSAANGLQACSEAQIGFTGFNPSAQINEFNTEDASCPNASKLGTVHIKPRCSATNWKALSTWPPPHPTAKVPRTPSTPWWPST